MIRRTLADWIAPDPPATTLSISDAAHLLQNRRRRLVVELVAECGSITLSHLSDAVASIEVDGAYDSSERKTVYVCLYQTHLPRLADQGVIEWEGSQDRVEPGENFDALAEWIDRSVERFEGDADIKSSHEGGDLPAVTAAMEADA